MSEILSLDICIMWQRERVKNKIMANVQEKHAKMSMLDSLSKYWHTI